MEQLKKYTELFEARFGKIDPNHTWGMDEEIGAIGAFNNNAASDKIITRADPGSESKVSEVLVNRNQWTEFDNNSKHNYKYPDHGTGAPTVKIPDYRESALGHDIQIPGFPHLNGLYYTANGNVLDTYKTDQQVTSGMIPAGDITPYEIQYVSNWFRTHPNPESIDLHLSDFFIQNVSCDFDQVTYATSGYEPYKTSEDGETVEWPSTGNNGANIETLAQAQAHNAVIDRNGATGTYAENLTERITYDLDYLGFKDMDGKWTHVNNFNRGNSNFSPEDNKSNPNREIKYIKSSGTEDFECRSSWSTGKYVYDSKWVLVHLTWKETVKHKDSPYAKGTVIPREGYYLAFDFAGGKEGGDKDQIVHRDGYYSNWIIKITPGYFNPAGNSKRIFCEDLGATDDIDFNDAVIDVAYEKIGKDQQGNDQFQSIITVQATGATLPIYVEHKSKDYELHKMLGSDNTTTMINVAAPGNIIHPVATYRGGIYKDTNAGQIKIWANNVEITGRDADTNDNERTDNIVNYKDKVTLAPMAFSTPTTVMWMKERKSIDLAYKNFTNWVQDQNWKTPGTGSKWYQNVTNAAGNLYPFVAQMQDGSPTSPGVSENPVSWVDIIPDPDVDVKNAVAGVKADSYMKLNDYVGDDAIVAKLNGMGSDDRVTFVVVLSSNTLFDDKNTPLQATLIPTDISGTTTSYKGTAYTASQFSRFNNAVCVPDNHDFCSVKTDIDKNTHAHTYTYTLQFSFKKSEIMRNETQYHDYMLLFLKSTQTGNIITPGEAGDATGVNGGVTVQKWYVHY